MVPVAGTSRLREYSAPFRLQGRIRYGEVGDPGRGKRLRDHMPTAPTVDWQHLSGEADPETAHVPDKSFHIRR